MGSKNLLASLRWVSSVSARFARIDSKGRSAATSFLATLGICFGVMTLITVISVMNGFQAYSINPIMEISSGHIRVSDAGEDDIISLTDYFEENKKIRSALPFYESQGLLVGNRGKQSAAVIRAVDPEICIKDPGFHDQINIVFGNFNLEEDNSIVLGKNLANQIGVTVGSVVNIMALAGGKDVDLISKNRQFTVTGLFETSYSDINQSFAFVSLDSAEKYFGSNAQMIFCLKLNDYSDDFHVISEIKERFPAINVQSWREFNKSFFGALRIEKNILMLLVCIIFLVVGINIYNGMRRLVFERRQDISIFSALGGTKSEIKSIFIIRGFSSGLCGSLAGLILGLIISLNIRGIFDFAALVFANPMFSVFAKIPARIIPGEIIMITLFGIASPLWASWRASNHILNMKVAEVLHDE